MQSGSPLPVGDITNGQQYYDFMVAQTGCSGANDTLSCLRGVPYTAFKAALDQSPGIYAYQVSFIPLCLGSFANVVFAVIEPGMAATS